MFKKMLSLGTTLVVLGTFMGQASAQDCDTFHLLQSLPSIQQVCCLQVTRP